MLSSEEDPIIGLYQSLTIEQCRELYLKQKWELKPRQRFAIKCIIGSKYIYGDEYVPNHVDEDPNKKKK